MEVKDDYIGTVVHQRLGHGVIDDVGDRFFMYPWECEVVEE